MRLNRGPQQDLNMSPLSLFRAAADGILSDNPAGLNRARNHVTARVEGGGLMLAAVGVGVFGSMEAPRPGARLILIRHGQSQANRDRLVTGAATCDLTDRGRDEVAALTPHMHAVLRDARRVVSPLRRARTTASLLAPDLEWTVISGLAETDGGPHAEWPQARFEAEYPDFWPAFDPNRAYPGGESHAAMAIRAVAAMAAVLAKPPTEEAPDVTVAVLHNGPLAAILHAALGIDLSLFPAFEVPTASLSVLEWGDRHRPGRPILRCLGWRPEISSVAR